VALTDAHPFPQMHEFDSPLVHDAEVILKRLLNAHEELTSAMATAKSVGAGMRDLAVKHHADLIVLGSSHRGVVGRIFAGHEVSDVVRKAPCAIAITPAGYDGSEPLHKIIVGYDGEPEAEAALSEATQLRETDDDTTITVVDVIEPTYVAGPIGGAYAVSSLDEGYQRVRSQLRELSNREDVKSEIALGAAGKELARAAEEADLLMIGLRRHGFMGGGIQLPAKEGRDGIGWKAQFLRQAWGVLDVSRGEYADRLVAREDRVQGQLERKGQGERQHA